MYLAKKKTIRNDPNFFSNKDYYDWEENMKKGDNNDMKFSKTPFVTKSYVSI